MQDLGWTRRETARQDIACAIIAALQAPAEAIHNEVFNVGDTSQNYRVREIAEVVGEVFPDCRVSFGAPGQDNRSYRVSFEKIRKHLPGFRCAWGRPPRSETTL